MRKSSGSREELSPISGLIAVDVWIQRVPFHFRADALPPKIRLQRPRRPFWSAAHRKNIKNTTAYLYLIPSDGLPARLVDIVLSVIVFRPLYGRDPSLFIASCARLPYRHMLPVKLTRASTRLHSQRGGKRRLLYSNRVAYHCKYFDMAQHG